MAKLYFKYGAMGSSKTANALITKFNYEERGMKVWLIKPSTDSRDGECTVRSRIGLSAEAQVVPPEMNIGKEYKNHSDCHVIIADECQFFTPEQIAVMSEAVEEYLVQLIMATRYPEKYDSSLKGSVLFGASPRATLALDRCAKVHAWLKGKDFVTPEDLHAVVYDILRHRLILSFEAQAEGLTTDHVIASLLKSVPLP